jgi:hypothetical protein
MPRELADILKTIRLIESSERYDIRPNKGNASGAYQYIASTWNNYAGYPHAYLAPPHVQDERALADVEAILWTWKGDVSMVPVIWYYPRAAVEPALMDIVPVPSAGNILTVREYQHRWLQMLAFVTGGEYSASLARVPPELKFLSGTPPEVTPNDPDTGDLVQISFPLLGSAAVVPPVQCAGDDCEPGAPAIVFGSQKLQPILAAVNGVVTAVQLDDPISGSVTVTITDLDGRNYRYSGFNDDSPGTDDGEAHHSLRLSALAQVGTHVRAGQVIGYLGDTDPMPTDEHRGGSDGPVWPHLRLTIRDADGTRLDADALVAAAQERQACHVAIGPWSVPVDARLADADRDDVEVGAFDHGGWTLLDDGTVTAYGGSALVLPPGGCEWTPDEAFGPGARGNPAPEEWYEPFTIPARFWVSGTRAGHPAAAATLVRKG